MNACWPVQIAPTPKAVLMSIADRADDSGLAWPSVADMVHRTCFGRTAVMEALKCLEAARLLLIDRSTGRNNRCQIVLEEVARRTSHVAREPDRSGRRTSSAGEPVGEADQSASRLSPVREPDAHQSGSRTPPVREADPNPKEPSVEPPENPSHMRKGTSAPVVPVQEQPDLLIPSEVPLDAWHAYVDMRKSIRKPLTANATALAVKKLCRMHRDGVDVRTVLENATIGSWTGLYAPKPDSRSAVNEAPWIREKRMRIAEMTGGLLGQPSAARSGAPWEQPTSQETIDVPSRLLG